MTALAAACSRSPGAPRARVALAVGARRARRSLCGVGADGDGRLPDLARRRAAADPLADRRDRRASASSGSRGRSRATSSGSPRTTSRCASLGRIRVALLRADRAARAGRARGLPARRSARADGRRRRRAAEPPPPRPRRRRSSRSSPAPCSVAVTAAFLPGGGARARRRAARSRGVAVPALAARARPAAGRRQAAARGELTAELVELLRGAPELVVYGREDETPRRASAAPTRALARLGRRDALAAGLADALAAARHRRDRRRRARGRGLGARRGRLDRVLVASLALLALASFEAVAAARRRRRASSPRRSPPAAACSS